MTASGTSAGRGGPACRCRRAPSRGGAARGYPGQRHRETRRRSL